MKEPARILIPARPTHRKGGSVLETLSMLIAADVS